MLTLIYIIAAAIGALLVGLIGIGNSLIIMPTLVIVFPKMMASADVIRLAAGTTMAVMTVGAIAAASAHFRARSIDLKLLRLMLVPYFIGAVAGPWVSLYIPPQVLPVYLGGLILIVALKLLFGGTKTAVSRRYYQHHLWQLNIVMCGISLLTSIAGLASGIFTIPYLLRFQLALRTVIGTSTAGAALYSAFGTLGYVSAGWSATTLPAGSFGFVYLPAFAVMAVTVIICAPLGVKMAGRIGERLLRIVFAIFLLVVAFVVMTVSH